MTEDTEGDYDPRRAKAALDHLFHLKNEELKEEEA
jgi:hypothetical protein